MCVQQLQIEISCGVDLKVTTEKVGSGVWGVGEEKNLLSLIAASF